MHFRKLADALEGSACLLGWRAASLVILLVATPQALSQVSVLDSSFQVGSGTDGPVDALVVQSDDRILVGGEFTTISGLSNSYLARLNADGSVDSSFNPGGQTDGAVACMVLQPDGKVLVGGSFNNLLGVERHGLARLLADGSADPTFSANIVLDVDTAVSAVGLKSDGKIVISYYPNHGYTPGRIAQLDTNGTPDPTWVNTNEFQAYVYTFLAFPDGSLLAGAYPETNPGTSLFRLQANGQLDGTFNSGLGQSVVFRLLRKPGGHILVGGMLTRVGESNSVPLLQLTPDLQWDLSFNPDAFDPLSSRTPAIQSLVLQPDGKIAAGGDFFLVAGYTRRGIVRLTAEGHIDHCFDPGLGLGGTGPGAVRSLARQSNGRIVLGGNFNGTDGAYDRQNLARLLPQSGCDLIRVYMIPSWAVAATLPPGSTNVLESSEDLQNWQELERTTNTYIYHPLQSISATAPAFFRAKQEQ